MGQHSGKPECTTTDEGEEAELVEAACWPPEEEETDATAHRSPELQRLPGKRGDPADERDRATRETKTNSREEEGIERSSSDEKAGHGRVDALPRSDEVPSP